jgi:iron complex outermembrane receptor protein
VRGPIVTLPQVIAPGVLAPRPTPVGTVIYQQFPYFNASQTHVNGFDIDFLSHHDIGAGRLTPRINYTHMIHYIFGVPGNSFDLAGTHGPQIISGDTGNPKDRATASLAWDQGGLNVTVGVNYVGHFNLTDPTSLPPTCPEIIGVGGLGGPQGTRFPGPIPAGNPLLQYCDVKAFTTVDLYSSYTINQHVAVHGSVLNLLGQDPPVDLQTYGTGGANLPYNPAMHQSGAVGRFFNIGATYTF